MLAAYNDLTGRTKGLFDARRRQRDARRFSGDAKEDSMHGTRSLIAAVCLAIAGGALAQDAPVTIRATIQAVSPDNLTLNVRTREGEDRVVRLKDPHTVNAAIPASLADIKPGSYIGTAASPGPDGVLKAMEVHIFPESARGAGEGFRPFDMGPGSTMTNGAVSARVEAADGPKLTVTYKGGEQSILVDAATPIITFTPGALSDLKPGASISVRGATKASDGAYEATRVLVGKDGMKLPI
jgi:Domain of unknown function (DUF5666)